MTTKQAITETGTPRDAQTTYHLVDCDVHARIQSIDDLLPYLPDLWQRYVRETGFAGPPGPEYPKVKPKAAREDSHPPGGKVPGADRDFLIRQHMDPYQIDRAILTPLSGVELEPMWNSPLLSARRTTIS